MANENMVTNIADLWVAATMNVDNEEVFENDDTELEGPNESIFDLDGDNQNDNSPTGAEDTATERGKHIAGMSLPSMPSTHHSSHVALFCHLSSPWHQASQSPQQCRPSLQYGTSRHPFDVAAPPCHFSNTIPGCYVHTFFSFVYPSSFQEGCPLHCYTIYDTKVFLCYEWMLL
jgi:hypothetical protein